MDFKPNGFPAKNGPFLSQNKIPKEMLASYGTQKDFEPVTNEFQQMAFENSQGTMSQYYPYYQYQAAYSGPYSDPYTPFSTKFPRARDYNNEQSLLEALPHLKGVNDVSFDIESVSPNAQFYILRSGNDDNIHKAIKYHIWTSTPIGKNTLRQAWQGFLDNGLTPEIYLIFSVVNSNLFLGVAKMTSNVDDEDTFKYWWEPCRWFGTFQLKWLFVKDIHHSYFENITEGDYKTPVITFRDSTPISADSGKIILQIFKEHPSRPNIFESFEYMDRREDYIRVERDLNPDFQTYFEECCKAHKENPDTLKPQRRPYPRKAPRKSNYSNRKYNSNHYREKNLHYKKNENWFDEKPTNSEQQFPKMTYKLTKKEVPEKKDKHHHNKGVELGNPEDYPDLEEATRHHEKSPQKNSNHVNKQSGQTKNGNKSDNEKNASDN